jgi:CHAD domain-containing protein
MLWNHLCAVRAFDVLPALPSSEHLHELRVAVKRLHYFVDAVREVLPETLTQTLTAACAELQKNLGEVNDAHTAALYSLEFIVRDRTMRKSQIQNVMQFAATQQDIVNERAPQWKTLLDPLLTIGM